MTTVRLTRRQWLMLPIEHKAQSGDKRFIVVDGRTAPVQWCARLEDSHLQEGIDTKANGH